MTTQTDNATGRPLKIGAFYWVWPALDPDTDNEWENKPQPARYAGDGKWNCPAVDGASDWPMRWVGDEILPPSDDLKAKAVKSDADTLWLARMIEQGAEPGSFYAQAAQPSLDSVVTHWRARAAEHASSRDESYQEYAAGITDALNAVLSAQQPAQAAQGAGEAVASIYITPDGSREMDDWKHDLPVGQNILYTQPAAGADVSDTALLDWLTQHDGEFFNYDRIACIVGTGFFIANYPKDKHASLRAAIRAAIAASGRQS